MDTISGMRTFCAVATEESFSRAAEQMGMSAALTSKYIAQLEERLGVRLLHCTTRSLALTENGEVYYRRCLDLIDEFDEIEATVKEDQHTPKGRLRISAPITFGETYLVDAIACFIKEYPEISIDMNLSEQVINIVRENYDVAIRHGVFDHNQEANLVAEKIASTRIVLCATPKYLANSPPLTHPRELAAHNCIINTTFKSGSRWSFIIDGEKHTFKVAGSFRVNSINATRNLMLKHMGIALCGSHEVAQEIAEGLLVSPLQKYNRYDAGDPGNFSLYAIYKNQRHLPIKTRVFVDFLTNYFSNISGLNPK